MIARERPWGLSGDDTGKGATPVLSASRHGLPDEIDLRLGERCELIQGRPIAVIQRELRQSPPVFRIELRPAHGMAKDFGLEDFLALELPVPFGIASTKSFDLDPLNRGDEIPQLAVLDRDAGEHFVGGRFSIMATLINEKNVAHDQVVRLSIK
jgi:hypothetical protein